MGQLAKLAHAPRDSGGGALRVVPRVGIPQPMMSHALDKYN
jgi:hypothetical protein